MRKGLFGEALFMWSFAAHLIFCIWLSTIGPDWIRNSLPGVGVTVALLVAPMPIAGFWSRRRKGAEEGVP